MICIYAGTTGNQITDDIIQLVILDGAGNILFNEYFCPENKSLWPCAAAQNGITPEQLDGKPHFSTFTEQIRDILYDADMIIGYSLFPVLPILKRNGIIIPEDFVFDISLSFSEVYGECDSKTGAVRPQNLAVCADYFGCTIIPHGALECATAVLYCFYQLSKLLDFIDGLDPELAEYYLFLRATGIDAENLIRAGYGIEEIHSVVYGKSEIE